MAGGGGGGSSRSASRISKPTMLSPIIGTPNKDSAEHSAQEDELNNGDFVVNRSTPIMSPTRIPMRRAGSSTNLQPSSRLSSTANSRAGSREPSPGMPRKSAASATSKPFVRKGSQRVSITTAKPGSMTNASKLPMTKSTGAVDTTATRKGSMRRPVPPRKDVVRKSEPSASRQTTTKRPPAPMKRESSNLKRETSNLRPLPLKREVSNVSKLKRESSNLKRENSTLKRETLKREGSNTTLKKGDASLLKRQTSKLMLASSVLSKNKSDSQLTKRMEKSSDQNEKRRTNSESNGAETDAPTNVDASVVAAPKQTSMEKLVPMTATNVVSMTTAAIAAQPVQITTAVTNSTGSLSKANSSSQLLETMANGGASSLVANISDQTPTSTILEKSQKTLEIIQKTVTDATDEIHRTIDENLTDLKSMEYGIKMEEAKAVSGGTVTPAATAAVTTASNLSKKASTRTLLDKVNEMDRGSVVGKATTPPIDAAVSVIEKVGSVKSSDSAEKISEKSTTQSDEQEIAAKKTEANEEQMLSTDVNDRLHG